MEILKPVDYPETKRLRKVPQEYAHLSIEQASAVVLTGNFGTLISEHIAFDLFWLRNYVFVLHTALDVPFRCGYLMYPLNFVLGKGTTLGVSDAKKVMLRERQFQLLRIPPGDYEISFEPGQYRFLQIEIVPAVIDEMLMGSEFIHAPPEGISMYENASINIPSGGRHLLKKIMDSGHEGIKSRLYIETAAKELLLLSIEEIFEKTGGVPGLRTMEQVLFQEITDYILDRLDQKITAQQICSHFKISRTKLYKGFQQLQKMGVHEYIIAQKIQKAELLLGEGQPVNLVSDKLGFNDASNFVKFYKQHTGRTPANNEKGGSNTISPLF